MGRLFGLAIILLLARTTYAQDREDTTSLLHAFRNGSIHGHLRYFYMATDNAGKLKDFHANAIGGGIKYETAPFRHFRLGISGYFVFNAGSTDLTKVDESTGKGSRYELGLFDVEDPANKTDMDRLEELYLKYDRKHWQVTVGRLLINTPLVNLQDGRMRPTESGGLWIATSAIPRTKVEAGYLYELSPRGTVKWYRAEESIGLFPGGVNAAGAPSAYAGNVNSKGIAMLGITHQLNDRVYFKAWDLFAENLFNTTLLQAGYSVPFKKGRWRTDIQYYRQHRAGEGGNPDPSLAYVPDNHRAQVISARTGFESSKWQGSLNYTRITSDGAYLFPREWGSETFFTFLARERNEGAGEVNAFAVKAGRNFPKSGAALQAGIGYYDLPSLANYRLNKYGMPSYWQFNLDARYAFHGMLKGLELQGLYVYKGNAGIADPDGKYLLNKVNMHHWSLVVNYHF